MRENTIRFSCIISRTNSITKRGKNERYNDLKTFRDN